MNEPCLIDRVFNRTLCCLKHLSVIVIGSCKVWKRKFLMCRLKLSHFACLDQGAGKSAVLNSLIGHPVLVSCILSVLEFVYFPIG